MANKKTRADELVELTALTGELPADAVHRLGGGRKYKINLVTEMKKNGVIKSHYKNKLRGFRLTAKTKKMLLENNPERFDFYITGEVDTNNLPSGITRRLRLHRIADVIVTMYNAGVKIFRDDKPDIFREDNDTVDIRGPTFYGSREFKSLGNDMVKLKNGRAVGVLLTDKEIYIVYNTENAEMKWDYKAEISMKSIMEHYLYRSGMTNQYSSLRIFGLLFGSNMEMLYQVITSDEDKRRNNMFLDKTYDEFIFLTNDRYGEILLKLLCDTEKRVELDRILRETLRPLDRKSAVENDAINSDGNPVLFAYLPDIPRLMRFVTALNMSNTNGSVICFDFQKDVLRRYCGERVEFETIDFMQFERSFYP